MTRHVSTPRIGRYPLTRELFIQSWGTLRNTVGEKTKQALEQHQKQRLFIGCCIFFSEATEISLLFFHVRSYLFTASFPSGFIAYYVIRKTPQRADGAHTDPEGNELKNTRSVSSMGKCGYSAVYLTLTAVSVWG